MHNDRRIVNLALIGFMGTGKTSVGRLVADQLRFDYLDTDELIQSRTGRTITDIFAKDGEAGLPRARTTGYRGSCHARAHPHRHRRRSADQAGESCQP